MGDATDASIRRGLFGIVYAGGYSVDWYGVDLHATVDGFTFFANGRADFILRGGGMTRLNGLQLAGTLFLVVLTPVVLLWLPSGRRGASVQPHYLAHLLRRSLTSCAAWRPFPSLQATFD